MSSEKSSKVEEINNVLCIGSGYVGALTMTIFANKHPSTNFYIFDVLKPLIDKWNSVTKDPNTLPIVEKDLFEPFNAVFNKNLLFISEITDEILLKTDLIFVCVNTPSITNYKYGTDLSIEEIGKILNAGIELSMDNVYKCVKDLTKRIISLDIEGNKMRNKIFIQKSTVAIMTLEHLYKIVHDTYKEQNSTLTQEQIDEKISLVNIPEFLAEGTAISNLLNPDRVVIGHIRNNAFSKKAADKMKHFYLPFVPENKIIQFDSISSEMTKLVSNAFLAQRISSINTISELCEKTKANIHSISTSVGSDSRIGKTYLKASMGFGGSCFKKDILSLIFLLNSMDLKIQANYWSQVLLMNEYQRLRICKKVFDSSKNKPIAILGLAFKGNVGDVRCSNSVFLLSYLLNQKSEVRLYDPYSTISDLKMELKVYDNDKNPVYNYENLVIYRNIKECVKNCSVCVFVNDHDEFKHISLDEISKQMDNTNQTIFDLFNNFSLDELSKHNFKIFKLGEFDGTI